MHPDTPLPEQLADALRELLNERPIRYGWKRSVVDQQQLEYIIQREDVLKAVAFVQRCEWQSIDCLNKSLAEKIRENALHALATLAIAMRANEEKIL